MGSRSPELGGGNYKELMLLKRDQAAVLEQCAFPSFRWKLGEECTSA